MDEEVLAIAILIGVVIGLLPMIFYLLTLQNTLKAVSEKNRKMPPGQVWLNLIPLFGIVWAFIVVNRIADSLADEFRDRGITTTEPRPGYGVGLAYCICFASSIIPFLGTLAALAGLILWIVYWVKIAGFKNDLTRPTLQAGYVK